MARSRGLLQGLRHLPRTGGLAEDSRRGARTGALILALALAFPGAALAEHIGIKASTSAALKERSGNSWIVEVRWGAICAGSSGSVSWHGSLNLVDDRTGVRTYMGGVSSGSGTAIQFVTMARFERYMHPHLRLSCSEDSSRHGSPFVEVVGNTVIIPGLDSDGLGGGGRGRRGSGDPTEPLRRGGCSNLISGTDQADRLPGGGAGDLVFGFRGGDRITGDGGHDCLIGGEGNDVLRGEAGSDRLTGGPGRDALVGGRGTNAYDAGPGNDFVNARNGRRELIRCGRGRDRARVDRRDRVRSCERVSRRR